MQALLLRWILAILATVALQARPAPKAPAAPVDLNAATATELMQLPGIGAKTAQRIVDYRRAHGPFQRVEELLGVKGIGEKAFLRLKEHLRAEAAP